MTCVAFFWFCIIGVGLVKNGVAFCFGFVRMVLPFVLVLYYWVGFGE